MKQIFIRILIFALLLGLTGCGAPIEPTQPSLPQQPEQLAPQSETPPSQLEEAGDGAADQEETVSSSQEMTLSVEQVEDGIASVCIHNGSGAEQTFSTYYSLEQEQKGQWYPLTPVETLGFEDVAYRLEAGEQVTVTCDLNVFGLLAPGHYRLGKDEMMGEFTLRSPGNTAKEDGVVLTATPEGENCLRVTLENQSDRDTSYLWAVSLWRLEDGLWQRVEPVEPVGICGVQDPLRAGERVEWSEDLSRYGELPAGSYRLIMEENNWTADFQLS